MLVFGGKLAAAESSVSVCQPKGRLRDYETTILHFSSMEFFDDIFCYLSYFSGQKWPFSLSLRFLGPYLVHLQRFEITYPGKVSKIEKTKKSLYTVHPIKDFFHIATNVRVLCDNFFMFYKNFGFITKKRCFLAFSAIFKHKSCR